MPQQKQETIPFMIDAIIKKLKMASVSALKPEHFDEKQYDEIKDIYELVMDKNQFSISEMEAIVSELGKLRKNN